VGRTADSFLRRGRDDQVGIKKIPPCKAVVMHGRAHGGAGGQRHPGPPVIRPQIDHEAEPLPSQLADQPKRLQDPVGGHALPPPDLEDPVDTGIILQEAAEPLPDEHGEQGFRETFPDGPEGRGRGDDISDVSELDDEDPRNGSAEGQASLDEHGVFFPDDVRPRLRPTARRPTGCSGAAWRSSWDPRRPARG